MVTEDDLMYSEDAVGTVCVFYQDLNDINIFVEDEKQEYLYETIFKRLLGDNYRVERILGAGGKVALINRFHEFGVYNQDNSNKKNVYIADGDFDRYVCSDDMIKNEHFIYLETYNIENYLVDKDACEEFVKGRLKCLDNDVEAKLGFIDWKNTIVEQASKLFLCYCFIKRDFPQVKTVDRKPYLFIDDKTGLEKDGAFEKYWEEVVALDEDARNKIMLIKEEYCAINGADMFNLICGKFLLTSLYCHIQRVIKRTKRKTIERNDFKWHLICNFDISTLAYVKERIVSVMAS